MGLFAYLPVMGMFLFLGLFLYSSYTGVKSIDQPELPPWLVALPMGKERNLGGSSRDASMFTQSTRRTAIVNGHYADLGRFMRESTHTTGFTNGVVEIFSIGSICQRIVKTMCPDILEGGTPETETINVLEGGDVYTEARLVWDGGSPDSIVCEV
jgi:hypothetical protein